MKNRILILVPFLLLLTACNLKNSKVSEANNDETEYIKPFGDQISKKLIISLQTELKKAIKTGGIEEAIGVCNLKAIPLTGIIEKSTDMDVEIKRTSFKYRNELNSPNEYEEMALNYFHSKIENNESLPDFYIQKIEFNGENFYYYYKPLRTKAVCLNCHGTDEFITPKTKSLIQEYYPEDKALGYNDGDFRGLIRIKFPDFN